MKQLAVISLFLLLEASAFSAALPASTFETPIELPAPSTPDAAAAGPPTPTPLASSAFTPGPAASVGGEPKTPLPRWPGYEPVGPLPTPSAYGTVAPDGSERVASSEELWWYGHESFAPRPQTINVTSSSSLVLIVKDGSTYVQIPTDLDIAAGAKPVAFANNSTLPGGWLFSGKLFETTVGNMTVNVSHDMDLGIPNQTLALYFDGVPYNATGAAINTSGPSGSIPPPFQFANGTYNFSISRFPDAGCGGHLLRVEFNNQTPGNNASFYASVFRDFRVYVTCETTLSISADLNPAVVGQTVTFYGTLIGSHAEAVPGRAIQVIMDGANLLGQTGPGAFVDEIAISGANFTEDFETNGTGWNQTGAGTGTWQVGKPELPDGPKDLPGSTRLAGTGLKTYYGKGLDTWLTSREIDLQSPTVPNPTLSFSMWFNVSYDDLFEVAISTDGGSTYGTPTRISGVATSGFTTSPLDPFGNVTWDTFAVNLTAYIGVARLVVGFHFNSVDRTAVTNGAGVYNFRFAVPPDTTANYHTIVAKFNDGIELDPTNFITVATKPSWDLSYQYSLSINQVRLQVLRLAHFEFNLTDAQKTGFRGKTLDVEGTLLDNMGQVLVPNPAGDNVLDKILVDMEWDLDYNDPFDTPKILARDWSPSDTAGNYRIGYQVDTPQSLGLHNVTFRFKGSDFYVPVTSVDLYRLMGHTYVIWPPDSERQAFRRSDIFVNGTLRVIPPESRFSKTLGDPVDGDLVHITWKGDEIPAGQVGVSTDPSGNFRAAVTIPPDEELGKKAVVLSYPGSDIYTALQSSTNWSVVSRTTIQWEDTSVYKGAYLYYNGTMLDDRGLGVANQTLTLFLDNETVQVITTDTGGLFSYPHFIPTDMTVGAKQVFIRFAGNPIYLNSSLTTFVAVKAHTQVLRTDHTQVVDRGKRLNVTGEIFEVYEGGIRGAPVGLEQILIRIQDIPLTVETSNSEGKFTFKSTVPPALPVGEATMFFEYLGSQFYDPVVNQTQIVIRGQAVVTFDTNLCFLNGAPLNLSSDRVSQQQEVECTAYVSDELGNPIASGDFRAFYAVQTGAGVLSEKIFVAAGPIDELGRFKVNVTWDDFVVGNRTLIGEFNGSFCPTFISPRTLCLRPGAGNLTLQYQYVSPPPPKPDPFIYIIAGIAIAAIIGSAGYFFWYAAKRRQLQKMQRIIRRAADRLVSGNPYAQVIFEAYRALARVLQANGYLRKDSETFREFESALRQALPIDAKSMDEFLSILEEARYSDHEIGEAQKDRAIASLNAVKGSIEQILLSGGAIAPPPMVAPPLAPPAPLPVAEEVRPPDAGESPPGENP